MQELVSRKGQVNYKKINYEDKSLLILNDLMNCFNGITYLRLKLIFVITFGNS